MKKEKKDKRTFNTWCFICKIKLVQFKIKHICFLFIKAIKNPLVGKFFMKLATCRYDKMEGIPKEPMPSTLVQNIAPNNGQ
jgi:hypothetical protein